MHLAILMTNTDESDFAAAQERYDQALEYAQRSNSKVLEAMHSRHERRTGDIPRNAHYGQVQSLIGRIGEDGTARWNH